MMATLLGGAARRRSPAAEHLGQRKPGAKRADLQEVPASHAVAEFLLGTPDGEHGRTLSGVLRPAPQFGGILGGALVGVSDAVAVGKQGVRFKRF